MDAANKAASRRVLITFPREEKSNRIQILQALRLGPLTRRRRCTGERTREGRPLFRCRRTRSQEWEATDGRSPGRR